MRGSVRAWNISFPGRFRESPTSTARQRRGFTTLTDDLENYEDLSAYDLDPTDEKALLLAHNECTFIWANREGWPVGVIMSYIWRQGRFWLTASNHRARIHALRRDPRCCVVVTSTGSPLPRNQAVTWKGICTLHEDEDTKRWFYPDLSKALRGEGERARSFQKYLDSPRRVILEVEPTQRIGYDGHKMVSATNRWMDDGA